MIHLYYHGGSANHGCEAIVRSTKKILESPMALWSTAPEEDQYYGLDSIVELHHDESVRINRGSIEYYLAAVEHKLLGSDYTFTKKSHKTLCSGVHSGDVCLSIGGDNYCYSGLENLGYYNRMLKSRGAKTVLWGCSVDPAVLTPAVVRDLQRYDLITVRESISLEGMQKAGLGDRVVSCADPAFQLEIVDTPLPDGFSKENTIGINMSPLAASYGNHVTENYLELLRFILEETEDSVLLIPHVVKKDNDDRETLCMLMSHFERERIRLVDDQNCMRLKSLISQCKLFVGARTHATIAAYSTGVPTLVTGYSIKAQGIATDLFGTDEHYVVPVQNMDAPDDLRKAFCWIYDHEQEIREHLSAVMPEYSHKAFSGKELVKSLE